MNFSARCISQLTSAISWYLFSKDVFLQFFALEQFEKNSSKCSGGTNFGIGPNKRYMEKGHIISLVGKNCPRDIHWGPFQSSSHELEPIMHRHIWSHVFLRDLVIFKFYGTADSSRAVWTCGRWMQKKLKYYERICCNQYHHNSPKEQKYT